MTKNTLCLSVALAAVLSASPAVAQTEIAWWHAMDAELGQRLEAIA